MSDPTSPTITRLKLPAFRRYVETSAWAIQPERGAALLEQLEARVNGAGGFEVSRDELADARARFDARANERRPITKSGGAIAVLPFYGVVAQRMDLMMAYCGGVSTEAFADAFDAAMNDPNVSAIVIDCDSPGGNVQGTPELAKRILAARGKGKQIIAVSNGCMASAAYWICSAADEVVCTPSGEVGSIGVFCVHVDQSAMNEMIGLKYTLIKAGEHKAETNPFEPLSPDAEAFLQSQVNEMNATFVSAVAKQRGATTKAVNADFGQGRCFTAKQALAVGMIDRIATLEDVLRGLGAKNIGASGRPVSAALPRPAITATADAADAANAGPSNDVPDELDADDDICPECGGEMEDGVCLDCGYTESSASAKEEDDEDDDEQEDGTVSDEPEDEPNKREQRGNKGNKGKKGKKKGGAVRIPLATSGAVGSLTFAPSINASSTVGSGVPPLVLLPPTAGAVDAGRVPAPDSQPLAAENIMTEELKAAVDAERKRAADIRALGKEHQLDEARIDALVSSGASMQAVTDEILKDLRTRRAAAPHIAVGADRATQKPFNTLGEQLHAIIKAETFRNNPSLIDPRLLPQAAASGMSEGVPSDGGFAIQPDFAAEIISRAYDTGEILSRVRKVPISESSNGLKINAIDETSRTDGNRFGGIQVLWASEADQGTGKKPKLREMELNLKKMIGVWFLTDELAADTTAMSAIATEGFSQEVQFVAEDAIINGNGVGKPLGIVASAAPVSVAKEAGQAAATFVTANAAKMFGRMWNRSLKNAVWLINQDVWQQLLQLTLGSSQWPVFLPPNGVADAPFGMLYGRPIVPVEYCQTLGTVGDVVFADLSQYLLIDKGGPQQAQSIHVKFLTDEMTFRITYRVDGQPQWNKPLTPKNGSNTLSPFITLQAR